MTFTITFEVETDGRIIAEASLPNGGTTAVYGATQEDATRNLQIVILEALIGKLEEGGPLLTSVSFA